MESWYKNISKTRNVTFIFQNLKIVCKGVNKIENIQMDSQQSINLFEIKKG